MSTPIQLYQDFLEIFQKYSVQELIEVNNQDLQEHGRPGSRGAFRTALLHAFSLRGLDLSRIVSKEDGFTSITISALRLENNVLIPINK
ncbi:5-oxoprolinase [Sphingobacterium spiritivorum]|nr:5-oxoprolinase [Sphingobacterium spiritivorum]QQT35933.1 5-oxoprolinase [Sphingobacterium spiritivorum]WQD32662.1 5-oxoprolinase [Sphingobacterium spiritivorum]SUJ13099.1 Uncharacterised protein [Sphingobacterium spiritivorum]